MSQTINIAQDRLAVDFPSVGATEASIIAELPLPPDLVLRDLHLGWLGENWSQSTAASYLVRFRLRFFRASSLLQDLFFSPAGVTNGSLLPSFSVAIADPATPATQLDPSLIGFTSGRAMSIGLDALSWPYVNGGSAFAPSAMITTSPLRFRSQADRVTIQSEPIETPTWIPSSADGVNDGVFNLFFAVVSRSAY